MALRISLDRFLKEHQITPYKLSKVLEGSVSKTSVYEMAKGDSIQRIDLKNLEAVIEALSQLTGKKVTPNDLLIDSFKDLK
jgi:hypothetical protein